MSRFLWFTVYMDIKMTSVLGPTCELLAVKHDVLELVVFSNSVGDTFIEFAVINVTVCLLCVHLVLY